MSNQIAERTIKSRYIIEVQNGHLDFIPKFSVFVRKRELYVSVHCSVKNYNNLLTNKFRRFASSYEGRMSLDGFGQG